MMFLSAKKKFRAYSYIWKRFKRSKTGIVGLFIFLMIIFIALFGPYIAPYDPNEQHWIEELKPPSKKFILGTDSLGRDVLSRMIYGTRTALMVGFFSVFIWSTIGILLGLISGYYGSVIDIVIQRIAEIVLLFPSMMLLILIISVFKIRSLFVIYLTLGLMGWPGMCRLIRGMVFSIKEAPFIEASKSIGARDRRLISRHILPNVIAPATINIVLGIPGAIMSEASLSFLGLGDPLAISWGGMINAGHVIINSAWWLATFPALMLFFTVISFNLMGDGLSDALDVKRWY